MYYKMLFYCVMINKHIYQKRFCRIGLRTEQGSLTFHKNKSKKK